MANADDNASLTIHCPAKLNLTLAVGAPREDGLHPIASVMVALDFGDTLHLEPCSKPVSTFKRSWATDAPKPHTIDWPIEDDLVYRAHALVEAEAGRRLPVHCELVKRIPAGAGLGGGSSDAAGMLVGLRRLFGLSISDDTLLAIAQQLGADVVFLIHALLGRPAAMVTGIGEVIEPLPGLRGFHAVLVFPEGACPTAEVYREFDQRLGETGLAIPNMFIQGWQTSTQAPEPHNNLTDAAIHACPSIEPVMHAIASLSLEPRLTGSGSCVFALVDSQEHAVAIAESIRKLGHPASPASFRPLHFTN